MPSEGEFKDLVAYNVRAMLKPVCLHWQERHGDEITGPARASDELHWSYTGPK